MHLPRIPDLSVYQLALDNLAPSQSLRVSPIALKSLVGAVLDVLIEKKIPATLWVKLPQFEDWKAELKQYQQVGVPHKIYLCSCIEDKLAEVSDGVGQFADGNGNAQIFPIQLADGSQLKREYFLIVISEQLSGLIVSVRCDPEGVAVESQSQPLLAVCTFEQLVIQQVLEALRGAIAVADTTPDDLLERGETRLPVPSASAEKTLLTQLLVKQVQRIEDILHRQTRSDAPFVCDAIPHDTADASELTLRSPKSVCDSTPTTPSPDRDDPNNKEEFIKRVVQELRTPLTNMKTALKLLDSAQLKSAQRQRYMQLLNRECDRQNSLIAGLLELVQLDSDSSPSIMPLVQVADIVPGVVSTYQPIAQEKGILLGYTISAGLPPVSCVEAWLRQIVINLLNNCLKYTPAGGQVRVRVTLQGDYVQLAFDDTGPGITPNDIPKIFESFYRGRSTAGDNTGAGLGLTIVQQLLLRCGGSISVTSKLGEGSSFKVLLLVAPSAVSNSH